MPCGFIPIIIGTRSRYKAFGFSEGFFYFHTMATVYILYSTKIDRFYTGSCKTLEERLLQHSNKEFSDSYTSRADDWILFFHLDGLSHNTALKIENHIKKMKSKIYIQNLKKYPDISKNLILKYS